jgi:hypothetical protein
MASDSTKELLKKRLRQEVARLYERDSRQWKKPVVEMLRELHEANAKAVFFGGTLRSLLLSRVFNRRPGRPRDIDIVISGSSVDALREMFRGRIARETRFGGLQLRHWDWQFDVWPLGKTWAFVKDSVETPEFAALPETTFFNLEAIAVDVWPAPGRPREIYSGNEQFFDGLLTKTLEINREENPFPELCVVRALVLASSIDFLIGHRLAAYIAEHGSTMAISDFEEIQRKHYGGTRQDSRTLKEWVGQVSEQHAADAQTPVRLPIHRQRTFWPDHREPDIFRMHALMLPGSADAKTDAE